MILTPVQIEFVNREKETLNRIIDAKPERGLFHYIARVNAFQAIVIMLRLNI
jgi:hypothetical protein